MKYALNTVIFFVLFGLLAFGFPGTAKLLCLFGMAFNLYEFLRANV